VGSVAWEHSGLGDEPQPIAGCWEAETLVAAAGYTVWGDTLAHIDVATHPSFRGHGYGTAAVSAIAKHALAHGYVLQYRTLQANTASIAIAQALGFQRYATTLFLRPTPSTSRNAALQSVQSDPYTHRTSTPVTEDTHEHAWPGILRR
jgi:GNAT superfamily N-acetyltransferase